MSAQPESFADDLATAILDAADRAHNEQELILGVESVLKPVLDALEIPSRAEYERVFLEGRADAVYGWLIIEYETPGLQRTNPIWRPSRATPTSFGRASSGAPGDASSARSRM